MDKYIFEKEAYNLGYLNSKKYKKHYKEIEYFNVWNFIMNNLSQNDKILDLGCGPSHLGNMLYDNNFKFYIGIDFSDVAINMAKNNAPFYTFILSDLTKINYEEYKEHKIISVETFEHLKNDIDLIKKLPKNEIIFSVPNYMCPNHYRIYPDEDFIKKYYINVINITDINSFIISEINKIYVIKGKII
jgi:2-polyprenyl-3-methyl-5-hydroxy-6-metoxy-1,4-benzoquinol methylase